MIVAILLVLVLLVFGLVSLFVRRHGEAERPEQDWKATDEIFVDPGTGRRMRVWLDRRDGSRHYVAEGSDPGHV